ncbi:MAG TPA: hypothetical protein VMV46_11365, partial [Thermoanaerobaculia bacterium]|nr:hypothetical protein [Thermoanaerobaculia bacterium]
MRLAIHRSLPRTPIALLLLAALVAAPGLAAPLPSWLADAAAGASEALDGVRLGACASIRLSAPHVTVAQWIDGEVFRWKEITQEDGSLCTLLLAPEARALSPAQAAALHDASAGARVA